MARKSQIDEGKGRTKKLERYDMEKGKQMTRKE